MSISDIPQEEAASTRYNNASSVQAKDIYGNDNELQLVEDKTVDMKMMRNEYKNKSANSLSNILSFHPSQTQLLKIIHIIGNVPSPNIIKNRNNANTKRRDSELDMDGSSDTIGLPNHLEILHNISNYTNIIKDATSNTSKKKNLKYKLNANMNVNDNTYWQYMKSKLLEDAEFTDAWIKNHDVSISLFVVRN